MSKPRPDWDIFCKVVDNFGDIGVCWRLARALADEHGIAVRLLVDDLASFRRLCPQVDLDVAQQNIEGIEVWRWDADTRFGTPPAVVIEAFGCGLPDAYLRTLPESACWVNLEYLSAEPWVKGCHGLSSRLPGVAPPRHFFFPGFVAGSGGLIRETGLITSRDTQDGDAVWSALGGKPGALKLSLFCYDNPALPALLAAWAGGPHPVSCLVPEGGVAGAVSAALGVEPLAAGQGIARGCLDVRVFPFQTQENYDRLLWAADCNFVRGEDSFVRAQWAARPFIWQAYPQQEAAHLAKLDAFLDLYCAGLDAAAASATRAMMRGWNAGELAANCWGDFAKNLPALRTHARRWSETLAQLPELTNSLVQFCAKSL